MIEVSHLAKSPVLEDVSFFIEKGESVLITGPHGSGKTLLLKLLFGMVRPDQGIMCIEGRDISMIKRRQIPSLRRRVGFICQEPQLFSSKRVWENLSYPLKMIGAPRSLIHQKVRDILQAIGLEDHRDVSPALLSRGEQQLLCAARACLMRPVVLLVDDPVSGCAQREKEKIFSLFREMHAWGTTFLFTSSGQDSACFLTQRTLFLRGGRVLERAA